MVIIGLPGTSTRTNNLQEDDIENCLHILITEDENSHVEAIRRAFEETGMAVHLSVATTLDAFRQQSDSAPPDIAILDLNLPDGRAVEILTCPPEEGKFPVLVMTSYGNEQTAVEAIKSGALEYIVKSAEAFKNMPQTVRAALREWKLIQERRKVLKALQESEERYRQLYEQAPLGYQSLDKDGRFITVNQSWLALLGYTEDEIIGKWFGDFLTIESQALFRQRFPMFMQLGHVEGAEFQMVRKDGSLILVSFDGLIGKTFEGEFRQTHCILSNITERKRIETALQESEERFRQLAESVGETFYLSDSASGEILYVSPAFQKIWGRSCESVYRNQQTFQDSTHPDDLPRIAASRRAINQTGHVFDEEYRILRLDGEVRWVREQIYPVLDENQQLVRFAGVIEDVTERKQLIEKMIQSQKLADLGTLTAGVAHEINSPLQVITGSSESILTRLRKGEVDVEKLERRADMINQSAWRVAEIVRSLLTYARPSHGELIKCDLNKLVLDSLLLIEHQLKTGYNIQIETKLGDNLPNFTCDPNKITQVVINLLANARDAMPGGGVITLRTQFKQESQQLMFEVTDCGCGIPENIQPKIFDPFYTTKPIGKGTGLGLSIVNGIVRAHGGDIEVESHAGSGSVFRVTFDLKSSPQPNDGEAQGDIIAEPRYP